MTILREGPTSNPGSGAGAGDTTSRRKRPGRWIGPLQITPIVVLVAVVMVVSFVFITYVTLFVHDGQLPLLATGFVVFGAGWVAIAVGSLFAMWRAASYARTGRATALALIGGFAGLAALGCFSITTVLTLVWRS